MACSQNLKRLPSRKTPGMLTVLCCIVSKRKGLSRKTNPPFGSFNVAGSRFVSRIDRIDAFDLPASSVVDLGPIVARPLVHALYFYFYYYFRVSLEHDGDRCEQV
jgi:hypothetical protein